MKRGEKRKEERVPSLSIGVDVGGTKIRIGLVTKTGVIEEAHQITTPAAGQDILPAITQEVERYLQESPQRHSIAGIGVGTGGIVDPWVGTVRFASALPHGWAGVEIKETLTQIFRLPVVVENDVNAAALAEYLFGHGEGRYDLVYMAIGTGIGGGAVLNGELYRGAQGGALDLGHMVVHTNGRPCSCGKLGCLEAYAAGASIERRYENLVNASEGSDKAVATPTARDIFRQAAEGDPISQQIVSEAATHLAVGISNLVECYDPGMIVLGGGVMEEGEHFLSLLRSLARYNNQFFPRSAIRLSKLGTYAGLVGAAALVWYSEGDSRRSKRDGTQS